MTTSVLVVDDQELIRHGFAMIIDAEPDLEVVGQAADGAEAVQLVAGLAPDVVLMDVRMGGMDGLEATRRIVADHAPVKVIILTTFDIDAYAFEGLRAGASGFLLKSTRPAELVHAIRTVDAGDAVLAPSTTRRILETFASTFAPQSEPPAQEPERLSALTQRERGIFGELAAGRTNLEIAESLTLSEATVKSHVARVLSKLELRDRVQVVIFAYENGLVGPLR